MQPSFYTHGAIYSSPPACSIYQGSIVPHWVQSPQFSIYSQVNAEFFGAYKSHLRSQFNQDQFGINLLGGVHANIPSSGLARRVDAPNLTEASRARGSEAVKKNVVRRDTGAPARAKGPTATSNYSGWPTLHQLHSHGGAQGYVIPFGSFTGGVPIMPQVQYAQPEPSFGMGQNFQAPQYLAPPQVHYGVLQSGPVSAQSYHQSFSYGISSGSFMGGSTMPYTQYVQSQQPWSSIGRGQNFLAPQNRMTPQQQGAPVHAPSSPVFVQTPMGNMTTSQGPQPQQQQVAPELKAEKTLKFKMDKNESKIFFDIKDNQLPVFYDFITRGFGLSKKDHEIEEQRRTKALVFEQKIKAFACFKDGDPDFDILKTELKDSKGTTNNKISKIIDIYKSDDKFKGFIKATLADGVAMRSVCRSNANNGQKINFFLTLLHNEGDLSKEDAGQIAKAISILEDKEASKEPENIKIINALGIKFIPPASIGTRAGQAPPSNPTPPPHR